MQYLLNMPMWLQIVLPYLLDQLLEYWLGKTDKVQAGSKLELILNLCRKFLATLKKPTGG